MLSEGFGIREVKEGGEKEDKSSGLPETKEEDSYPYTRKSRETNVVEIGDVDEGMLKQVEVTLKYVIEMQN